MAAEKKTIKTDAYKEDVKLFNRWSFNGVIVADDGLRPYINLNPILVPKTNGYYHNTAFYKTKINVVERFMTRMQVVGHKNKKHKFSSGHNTGKSQRMMKEMVQILETLEQKTKENPIQVLVTAIEKSAPREEVITIERSGARYAQAVDMGPQRRVDLVIRAMCQGAAQKSFGKSVTVVDALTEEILNAYKGLESSVAIAKKNEIEKMAAAAK